MDTSRRQFLKVLFIGGGSLIVGRVLGPLFSKSPHTLIFKEPSPEFNVMENERFLSVYDSSGEEVLQIDKIG